jgi:hypothetical protein
MKIGVYTISEEHMRPPVVELLLKWMYLQKIDVPKGDLIVSIFLYWRVDVKKYFV